MNALVLLLTLTSTVVLRAGDRLPVEGKPVTRDGVIMFRSGGLLYSMPATEVERIETENTSESSATSQAKAEVKKETPRRKPVSEEERKRLLAELEKNHAGTPPPPE